MESKWDLHNVPHFIKPLDKNTISIEPLFEPLFGPLFELYVGRSRTELDWNYRYYFEITTISSFQTMVGIGYYKTTIQPDDYFLGKFEDDSYVLSPQNGFVWQNRKCRYYCEEFNNEQKVGIYFNGPAKTLEFFKDGVSLGLAFTNLNTNNKFYPIGCCYWNSEAALEDPPTLTKFTFHDECNMFGSLKERCEKVILNNYNIPKLKTVLPTTLWLNLNKEMQNVCFEIPQSLLYTEPIRFFIWIDFIFEKEMFDLHDYKDILSEEDMKLFLKLKKWFFTMRNIMYEFFFMSLIRESQQFEFHFKLKNSFLKLCFKNRIRLLCYNEKGINYINFDN